MPQTLSLGNTIYFKQRQNQLIQARKTKQLTNSKTNPKKINNTPAFGGGMINRIANVRPGCGSCGGAR